MEVRSSFDRLNISSEHLVPLSKKEQGVYSFIVANPGIEEILSKRYGRSGLCLKIFKEPAEAPLEDFTWGQSALVECTIIQNLFARHGLSPRVYDIVRVRDRYAQVTDYAVDGNSELDRVGINEAKLMYGLDTRWDMNPKNYINGQLVDFQPWSFIDKDAYRQRLVDLAYKHAAWGSRSDPYQRIFGYESQREMSLRVEAMKLDEIDFQGLSVLDIGCNLGEFCREAARDGAKRTVGVDLPHVTDLAYELSNWLHYWNIDFIGASLPSQRDKIEGGFDVVYALSCKQCKPFPWLFEHCDDILYVEGHVPEKEHHYRPMLEEHFGSVEHLGNTRDHGPRPLFRCAK